MSKLRFIFLTAVVLLVAVPAGMLVAQDVTGVGTAVISDDAFLSDSITYSMTGVTAPANGTAYEGWLVSDEGSVVLSTGVMVVDDEGNVDHTFTSATGENLIRNYDKVKITIEPVPDEDPAPSGIFAFEDQIPPGGMAHVRHLVTDWPPGSGKGITTRLIEQLQAVLDEAALAVDDADATLAVIKQRAERVVNGIDGPDGANYADHDGDGTIEEIGDGQGAIFHANDAITHANLASGGSGNDPTVSEHAAVLVVNAQSSIDFMAVARDSAISNVLGATSASAAKLSMGIVVGLIGNALNGLDTDADGEFVGLGETGAVHAYREGQLMATYSFPGGEVEPEVEPPATGDSAVPLLAQIGVIASLAFLAVGGLLVLSALRSRQRV